MASRPDSRCCRAEYVAWLLAPDVGVGEGVVGVVGDGALLRCVDEPAVHAVATAASPAAPASFNMSRRLGTPGSLDTSGTLPSSSGEGKYPNMISA